MYSYNSSHKIIVVLVIIVWAIYQFSGRNTESNYFDNGQIKRTGSQTNNLNDGIWTWYFPNGEVELRGNFHDGKRTGSWVRYDSLGRVVSTSQYVENHIHGLFVMYDIEGNVVEQHEYRNDTLIKKVKLN